MNAQEHEALEGIAQRLGLTFADLGLLRCALTLRSWCNEHPESDWESNQRLEFLGDAVLDLVIGEILCERFVEQDEGALTPMRASLVSKRALAKVAQQWALGDHLFVGSGDERSGARERSATLSDALEAVIAAQYLDARRQGLDAITPIKALVLRLWHEDLEALKEGIPEDPRSALQNAVQGELRATPRYHYRSHGPHQVQCQIVVEHQGKAQELGKGRGRSRKSAGDSAAQDALTHGRWRDPS